MRTLYGDHQRYMTTYMKVWEGGYWATGLVTTGYGTTNPNH